MKCLACLALLLAVLTAGCGNPSQVPSAPTVLPATTTDIFTGTLNPLSANAHNFVVPFTGTLNITLRSVNPSTSDPIGVGLGVPSGLQCALSLGDATNKSMTAASTPQITGTAVAGTFCISVYDLGNVIDPLNYTVTVAHP